MPIGQYRGPVHSLENTTEYKGELGFRDYYTQSAAIGGLMPGYKPTVKLVYPEGMIRNSREAGEFIKKMEDHVKAYLTGEKINKIKYKNKYAGGPFHVSSGASGIYIFFLNKADQEVFTKTVPHFEIISGHAKYNARTTLDRAIKHQYQPENATLKDIYNSLRAEFATMGEDVEDPVEVAFPGAVSPKALADGIPSPAMTRIPRPAGRQAAPA